MNEIMYISPYQRSWTGPSSQEHRIDIGKLKLQHHGAGESHSGRRNVSASPLLVEDGPLPFLGFEASVDLIPELAEVVNGGDNGEKHHRIECVLSQWV